MQAWGEKMKAANDIKDSEKPAIAAPPAFKKDTKWRVWKEQFQNYLGSKVGQCKAPLTFVIRPLDAPGNIDDYPDDHDQMVYLTPQVGAAYTRDNGVVYDELKALLVNSPAFTWIRSHDRSRNGRAAWKALLAHYEGTTEQNRIKEAAYATIRNTTYAGEPRGWTYENYYHAHQEAHYNLELYGEIVSESRKVTDFLRGISDPLCNVAKGIVMATPNYLNNFTDAALFIASTLNITLSNTSSKRNISKTNTQGHQNRNIGGKNKKKLTRHYTAEEWKMLSEEERQKIRNARNAKKNARDKASKNPQQNQQTPKRNVACVTGTVEGDDSEPEIDVHEGNVAQILRQKGIASVSTDDAGDHMTSRRNTRARINAVCSVRNVPLCNDESSRSILKTRRQQPNRLDCVQYSKVELDSRADTCCAGIDFTVIEHTGITCEVHPYHPKYKPDANVPVVKAVTAYDHNGTIYILVINQALYFGEDMPNSLLNPNQMRSHGIVVDDCPTHLSPNQVSTHSIYFPEHDIRLPLQLHGIISYLSIRKPTQNEIKSCMWLEMTSDEEWNPYATSFEEDELKHQYMHINKVFSYSHMSNEDRTLCSISSVFDAPYVESHPIFQTSAVSTAMKKGIDAANLSQLWGIGTQTAELTLSATTQKVIRSSINPIERRYRTMQQQLRYRQLGGNSGRFYSDTFFSTRKSITRKSCCQIFVNNIGFYYVTPMEKESEASNSLVEFIQHVGIPNQLHTDGSKTQTLGEWRKVVKQYHIKTSETEPHSPWQNRAESGIRELKRHTCRIMQHASTPTCLWDYACMYVARIRNMMVNQHPAAQGRTPHEIVTGETPDISEYSCFQWYQPIWYLDNASFPESRKCMGHWLGVSHRVGQAMCFWIPTENGTVISRSSVQAITADELKTDAIREQLVAYDQAINGKIGHHINTLHLPIPNKHPLYILDMDGPDEVNEPWDHEVNQMEADDISPQLYDRLLTADVCFTVGEKCMTGTVTGYKRDASGNLIGKTNPNPLLNTRMYQVQFSDGTVQDYAANHIAEAIYAAVDYEGNRFVLLDEILDYRYNDDALLLEHAWVDSSNGNRHRVKTTKGCELCFQWKDGSTSWKTLANLKNSHPIEVSRFAKDRNLLHDPVFAWWAPRHLATAHHIVSAAKARYKKCNQKFGITIPRSVEEALQIDKDTGTTYWADAIEKEMRNNRIAFKFLQDNEQVPKGYTFICCHMNFEVKMDFTRKARFVAGRHMTDPPTEITYSSVVSRDSVRIGFLIAALNDLDLVAADIGNAYLQADTKEKIYAIAGPEFGGLQGRKMIIIRALYGLKSSGAAWHDHFAQTLHDLGFKTSYADPDVWMRPAVKGNGIKYYEYILVYVDDLLIKSHQAMIIVNTLKS